MVHSILNGDEANTMTSRRSRSSQVRLEVSLIWSTGHRPFIHRQKISSFIFCGFNTDPVSLTNLTFLSPWFFRSEILLLAYSVEKPLFCCQADNEHLLALDWLRNGRQSVFVWSTVNKSLSDELITSSHSMAPGLLLLKWVIWGHDVCTTYVA